MKRLYCLAFSVMLFLACSGEKGQHTAVPFSSLLLSQNTQFAAGETISLQFQHSSPSEAFLLVENANGITLLEGATEKGVIQYNIPKIYSQKAGKCHWKLLHGGETVLSGMLNISPSTLQKPLLEAYFGPPSLMAGETDYAMLVAIPVDQYDNALLSGSKIAIKEQSGDAIAADSISTRNLLGWKRIYSRPKAGKLLLSAYTEKSSSKELTSTIYPANAIDFEIRVQRTHAFADGNQIIDFITSELSDIYGNLVSDGTQVHFSVETSKGQLLSSWASTIQGKATAKLLHPETVEHWKVTAFVPGAAKSNTLDVLFEPALSDFDFEVSKEDSRISVGPINSFLEQLIPDGMTIELKIRDQNGTLTKLKTNTRNGMGYFDLEKEFFVKGKYQLEIGVGGITKTQQLSFNE